jgi:threonine dehydrogenase-like Zn-dependent dehydrogenase
MGSDSITDCADIVVEATGSVSGLAEALRLCKPRGVLILKSTIAADSALNLAPLVVNEITVVGSRCGPFGRGLREMATHRFPVERLITARYDLSQGLQAFQRARQRDALKVLVRCS